MMKRFLWCCVSGIILLSNAHLSHAAQVTMGADKDTTLIYFQNHSWANSNYGSNDIMSVSDSISSDSLLYEEQVLIAFDLSSVGVTHVDSAMMQIYFTWTTGPYYSSSDTDVWAHVVSSDWTESAATWNSMASSYYSSSIKQSDPDPTIPYNYSGWVNWDITDIVNDWLSGSLDNYGLMLRVHEHYDSPHENRKSMYSSENANTDLRPLLTLTYGSAIPEPATLVLIGMGTFGIMMRRKLKK